MDSSKRRFGALSDSLIQANSGSIFEAKSLESKLLQSDVQANPMCSNQMRSFQRAPLVL